MYSVAVDSLSLTATAYSADFKTHRSISAQVSYTTTLNGYARGPLDPVEFVAADTANGTTVAMPSHQVGDLVVVFALNTTGTGANNSPVTPQPPAGQPQWTVLSDNTLVGTRLKIAYLFATQNTTVVGGWIRATRTTVAIYRNTRGFVNDGSYNVKTNNNSIHYNLLSGLSGRSQPHVVGLGFANTGLLAATPPVGFTARASTQAAGLTAPGIGLSDRIIPTGTDQLAAATVQVSVNSGGVQTFSVLLTLEAGIPSLSVETGTFQAALNGDVKADSLIPRPGVFRTELSQVFTSYLSFYTADSASFTSSATAVDTHFGYYVAVDNASFDLVGNGNALTRELLAFPQSGGFAAAVTDVDYILGYFIALQNGTFSISSASLNLAKNSLITPFKSDYNASDVNALFKRFIIKAVSGTSGSISLGQVGIRNDAIRPAQGGGGARTLDYGGSTPSDPSFLRPQNVRFNSIAKSRDLGKLNNFLGTFSGNIGAETGTQTLFFKCELLGAASIQIKKNPINRYTDKQISVGILDSERKQIPINRFGFAFENEIESTTVSEFLEPMPKGTYFFTVSSSLWQRIPFSVEIQAIRFVELKGSADLTAQLRGRFAIAKLRGAATLTGPFISTIPSSTQLKGVTGPAIVSSGFRGALVIPSGLAVGRMTPYGRLKMTHKISGSASLSNQNLATLSSAPPSYGGYGSP